MRRYEVKVRGHPPHAYMANRPQVPRQHNANDCGFYLLHYASIFLSDPPKYRRIIVVSCYSLSFTGATYITYPGS
jgi:hypothetical protein